MSTLLFSSNSSQASQADLELVQSRIMAGLTSVPRNNTITNLLSNLESDGTWTDLNYNGFPFDHLKRLRTLCNRHRFGPQPPTQELTNNIFNAIDAWIEHDPINSTNWWHQEIGTPKELGKIVLIMKEELGQTRLNSLDLILARSYFPLSDEHKHREATNTIDRAYCTLLRALILDDQALALESIISAGGTAIISSPFSFSVGIQADGAFHQHGPQLHFNGYGGVYLRQFLNFADPTRGTFLALKPDHINHVVDYCLDGMQWMTRGDSIDYTTSGRGSSDKGKHSASLGLRGDINKAMNVCNGYRLEELNAFHSRLNIIANQAADARAADPATALTGNRNFWKTDYMAHHRPDFHIGVRTHSTRTSPPESGNGAGLKNRHLGDGVTIIHRTGEEYDDIMPCWDWRRLPGITTIQRNYSLRPDHDWGTLGNTDFAGGVSNGEEGIQAFNLSAKGVTVKKSWFFFGDTMIALGADVDCNNDSYDVITTLNQCLALSPLTFHDGNTVSNTNSISSSASGTWAHHDEIGYFFPNLFQGNSVKAQIKTQSGNWRSLSESHASETVSKEVFSIEINHGEQPNNQSYAYIVKPGITTAEMPNFPVDDYEILSNTEDIQAVRHDPSQTTGIVFRSAGSIAGITSDAVACVLSKQDGHAIKVSISDFAQINTNGITLEFDRDFTVLHADARITVQQESPNLTIRLNTENSFGRSFDIWLTEHPEAYEIREIVASEDTWIHERYPNGNHGDNETLSVRFDDTGKNNRESFFKFSIPELGAKPILASLKLHCKSNQESGIHGIRPIDPTAWQESSLTWNSRPPVIGPADARWIPELSKHNAADISSLLDYANNNQFSVRVANYVSSLGTDSVGYSSRETSTQEEKPTLSLVYLRSDLTPTEFDIWRGENFGEGTLHLTHTQPDGDPDGDGIKNIIEFATGQDPNSLSSNPISVIRSAQSLTLYVPRRLNSELNYKVTTSSNLTHNSWENLADIYPFSSHSIEGGIETLSIEVSNTLPRQFFRIEVEE